MRKQFDLNYYLEHPDTKVVTRDGRSARILCTDIKGAIKPIISVITITVDKEDSCMHHADGMVFSDRGHPLDLFFDIPDPQKKKVPLTHEDLLKRVIEGKTMWVSMDNKKDNMFLILNFGQGQVSIDLDSDNPTAPLRFLMDFNYYFADGDPCWKEVDCE